MKHFILSLVMLLSLSSIALAQEAPPSSGEQRVIMATIQFFCLPTEVVRQIAESDTENSIEVVGNNGQYGNYELWTDSDGWTLIMHAPNGLSCRIDQGVNQLPSFNIDNLDLLK